MSEPHAKRNAPADVERDRSLTDAVFEDLVHRGNEAWERLCDPAGSYHDLILADPDAARACLRALRPACRSFLELGSGVGVITIIADLLGFDACGIEIEPRLVEEARRLATHCGASATFAEGSFVPPDYRDDVRLLDPGHMTVTEGPDGYAELGLDIADFDLVYAYPWPDEEEWLVELVRRHAGLHTKLLCYSVRDGFVLTEL